MIAGITILKRALSEAKKASVKLFQGEITISKRECWMIGAILLLTGIAAGLINAPLTHGVNIGLFSNNGNSSANNNGNSNTNMTEAGTEAIGKNNKDNILCKPSAEKKKRMRRGKRKGRE